MPEKMAGKPLALPTSIHSHNLHKIVELIAGMGTDPHIRSTQNEASSCDSIWQSPQERLKDALSSPESFLKNYLDFTELTMGTYKHIGYVRSARFVGSQLAELYL